MNTWDYTINKYDQKCYWGDPNWRNILHEGLVKIPHPQVCGYCHLYFPSRNQLFKHLGYLNLDIRRKKKVYRKKKKNMYFRTIHRVPIVKGGISKPKIKKISRNLRDSSIIDFVKLFQDNLEIKKD